MKFEMNGNKYTFVNTLLPQRGEFSISKLRSHVLFFHQYLRLTEYDRISSATSQSANCTDANIYSKVPKHGPHVSIQQSISV